MEGIRIRDRVGGFRDKGLELRVDGLGFDIKG